MSADDRPPVRPAVPKRLSLIVNPLAGGGLARRRLGSVTATLLRLGLDHHVEPTHGLDHARELATRATAAGEMAVAFGGDGLIAAVADALKHTDGLLGVLPGGRGNDFARALGIPRDPAAACTVLAGGRPVRLDLGQVGGRTFIGIASGGFDSVANRVANETRLVRGNLVYAYGALRALADWEPVAFTVSLDGAPASAITGFTVAVANSGLYGGGMLLAPDAALRDGMLDVVMIRDMPKWRFLRLLPSVFSGRHVRVNEVEVSRARTVTIGASRPVTLYADGDPIAELPATVTVLPEAVRTMVPPGPPSRVLRPAEAPTPALQP